MNNYWGRAVIFLIVGGGCVWSLQYATSHFKPDRQLILLNRTLPDFRHFLDIEKQASTAPSRSALKEYFDYFKLVTEAMPGNSDGALMLGYLDQITGRKKKAGVLLKEAYRLDPQFFFTRYDLAFLLFEQADYSQSSDLLEKAIVIPPNFTLNHMMNSIIYRQVFSSIKDSGDIIAGLRQAYHDAYLLLIEASARSGQYDQMFRFSFMAGKMFPDDSIFFDEAKRAQAFLGNKELQGADVVPHVHAHIM